jgi:CRISPR-associated protein (TIGR03986 family)
MANNPTNQRPVHTNPTNPRRRARAPYNFIPLPANIVTTELPPEQDRYHENLHTGWFDCEMETCSPVYVRGMMTPSQFDQADKKSKDLSVEEKLKRAPFYSYQQKDGQPLPVIPGSSIRGMLRSLVEIVGYGKMKWVNDSPSITFRAVAAPREDPLSEPYRRIIGQFSSNVRAGYLEKTDEGKWLIWPAMTPKQMGWPDRSAFLKVKEKAIPPNVIKDFYYFDDPDYLPEYFHVSFSVARSRSKFGPFTEVMKISSEEIYEHKGAFVVCSGNMLETGLDDQKSPRRNHALVLPEDPKADPIELSEDLVKAYVNSLTPFQREDLWGKENGQPMGVLESGAPVFYVLEKKSSDVLWFGHTPNFRVPARTSNGTVTTPLDLIPKQLRGATEPDLAEAIFGWVEEKGSPKNQFASRVSVTDATFITAKDEIWYAKKRPITPATLASPKVTTFQHYLVQDKTAGHDPDLRPKLAHYNAEDSKTELRGYKLYWHKGERPNVEATAEQRKKESQLTRIEPVQPGVKFHFRVHFENLKPEELGALAWALTLPSEDGQTYRHKLGMGKPLGMGAVAIKARLLVTNRQQRYQSFFNQNRLDQAEKDEDAKRFIKAFEDFLLPRIVGSPQSGRLAGVDRIRMLLAMLQWREGSPNWLEQTRYQLIEHPKFGNEYNERPVLPDPVAVSGSDKTVPPKPAAQGKKDPAPPPANPTQAQKPPNPVASSDYKTGTVEDFGLGIHQNTGIIIADDPLERVFVHASQLTSGLEMLSKNQRVKFKMRPRGFGNEHGNEAYDVELITEAWVKGKEE